MYYIWSVVCVFYVLSIVCVFYCVCVMCYEVLCVMCVCEVLCVWCVMKYYVCVMHYEVLCVMCVCDVWWSIVCYVLSIFWVFCGRQRKKRVKTHASSNKSNACHPFADRGRWWCDDNDQCLVAEFTAWELLSICWFKMIDAHMHTAHMSTCSHADNHTDTLRQIDTLRTHNTHSTQTCLDLCSQLEFPPPPTHDTHYTHTTHCTLHTHYTLHTHITHTMTMYWFYVIKKKKKIKEKSTVI